MMEGIFNLIERAFNLLDTRDEILRLIVLGLITATGVLIYQVIQSQIIIEQFTEPRIVKFNQYCYQKNIRLNSTMIGIKFPVTDIQREAGVKINTAVFFMDRTDISDGEFEEICNLMKINILDPDAESFLLFGNDEYAKVLERHYRDLLNPPSELDDETKVLDREDFKGVIDSSETIPTIN